MKSKISIIIAVFNGEKLISKAINSVLNQKYKNIEIIIIDGDSKDKTVEEVKKYSDKIKCFISEPDLGIYDALNKGVERSSGDWIYIMGCDDELFNDRVFLNLENTLECPDVDIIYGKVALNFPSETMFFGMPKNVNKNKLLKTLSVWHQSIIVRRELFKEHKFNLDYKIAADLDWMLKVIDGKKLINVDQTICTYGINGESSLNKSALHKELLKILISNTGNVAVPFLKYFYWRLRVIL